MEGSDSIGGDGRRTTGRVPVREMLHVPGNQQSKTLLSSAWAKVVICTLAPKSHEQC